MIVRKLFLSFIGFVLVFITLNAKQVERDSFLIDGVKFQKPLKYVFFNSEKDSKKKEGKMLYFHIGNESFQFRVDTNKTDTCEVNCLQKIKMEDVDKLALLEERFVRKILEDMNLTEFSSLYLDPQIEFHPYFKVIIIEKKEDEIIKYEADWDYTGRRGLKEIPPY